MDDLIERLRDNSGDGGFHGGCQGCYERVMDEAADEIERLRRALRYFVGCSYPVATEINPRGHDWKGQDTLDFALGEAKIALKNGDRT